MVTNIKLMRDRLAAWFRRPALAVSRDPSLLNDAGLQAKVESEAFRSPGAPKGSVSVSVEKRVVYLRGEVASQAEIKRLINAVKSVDGVGDVRSLLHVPGETAPMKV
jgi:hypothetical protein